MSARVSQFRDPTDVGFGMAEFLRVTLTRGGGVKCGDAALGRTRLKE